MTISPLQNDYVTKSEFSDFRNTVNERFDTVDERFDAIDRKFDEFKEGINKDFRRYTDLILEKFQHDLKTTTEYLEHKIDKKLDREEFFVFMEGYYERIMNGIKANKQ